MRARPPIHKEMSTMKTFNRLYRGALLVSLLTAAIPLAVADEKGQASRAVLAESDRLQVLEIRQKPGEVTTPSTSATRVVRALQGGTMLRTYADGKTEKVEWKTGEVQLQEPGPQYTVRNVGNSEIVLYVVRLK